MLFISLKTITGGLLLARNSQAFTGFKTNCTLPLDSLAFVASPNVRGSLDILFGSLGVLIACAYTVLHFNIPRSPEHLLHPARRIKGEVTRKLIAGLSEVHWMAIWHLENGRPMLGAMSTVIAILAPEFTYSIAVAQYINAKTQLDLLRNTLNSDEGKKWKLAHMYFADMGGLILLHRSRRNICWPHPEIASLSFIGRGCKFPIDEDKAMEVWEAAESAQDFTNAMSFHSSTMACGDTDADPLSDIRLEPINNAEDALDTRQYLRFHLDAFVLCRAVQQGLLPATPPPLKSIEDRSKSDALAKCLVMLQLLAFGAGIISRLAERLPLAALEIVTTPFAICALVVYALFLNKPRDVRTPIVLGTYDKLPLEILEIKVRNRYFAKSMQNSRVTAGPLPKDRYINSGAPLYPMEVRPSAESLLYGRLAFLAIGVLFGVIHLAAWNIHFPTLVDAQIWRVAAIITTILPIVGAALSWGTLTEAMHSKLFPRIPLVCGCVLYFLARSVLAVEVVRGLFYLEPEVFRVAEWSWNIPHFS